MRHDPPYDPMAANAPAKGNKPAKKTKAVGTPAAGERLNKYLANSGLGSRRACEAFILAGRVDIDGEVVIDLGRRVDPERNIVRVDGERLRKVEQTLVLVLNKPVGYLSAASDPENRPLVYHLIPPKMSLRNIGRLDFNTEGVLLFTNDGDLAERLGHARFAGGGRGGPPPGVVPAPAPAWFLHAPAAAHRGGGGGPGRRHRTAATG